MPDGIANILIGPKPNLSALNLGGQELPACTSSSIWIVAAVLTRARGQMEVDGTFSLREIVAFDRTADTRLGH